MKKAYTLLAAALLAIGSYAALPMLQNAQEQATVATSVRTNAAIEPAQPLHFMPEPRMESKAESVLQHPDAAVITGSETCRTADFQTTPINDPCLVLTPENSLPPGKLMKMPATENCIAHRTAKADADWTKWTQLGRTALPESALSTIRNAIEASGDIFPDWDGSFTVMQRENRNDPNQMQLRFDDVFNHVNLTFDYDATTKLMTAPDAQPTGIAISIRSDVWYEEYHFFVSQGTFYPATGTIRLGSLWIYVAPGFGWPIGTYDLTLEGSQPLEFSVQVSNSSVSYNGDRAAFLSSEKPAAKFTVERSPQVKSYRVAVFPQNQLVSNNTISDLASANPTGEYPYSDYTAATFEIDLTKYHSSRYSILLYPLGADGAAMDNYTFLSLYSNLQEPHEWVSIGTATLTDIAGHTCLPADDYRVQFDEYDSFIGTPQTRQVQVDARKDNPSIFRIHNPFGQSYPFYGKMSKTFPQEDFYMLVDATDPSRAEITYSMSGIDIDNGATKLPTIICSGTYDKTHGGSFSHEDIEAHYAHQYGKYADNRVVFPLGSVFLNGYNVAASAPYLCDLELQLPGYVDYTMAWGNNGVPDGNANFTLTTSANVKSVDCALVSDELWSANRHFPEKLCKMVTDKADGIVIKNYPVENRSVIIPAKELIGSDYTQSDYHLVAVPLDASGNAHAGMANKHTVTPAGDVEAWSEWHAATSSASTLHLALVSNAIVSGYLEMRYSLTDNNIIQYRFPNVFSDINYELLITMDYSDVLYDIVEYTPCYRVSVEPFNSHYIAGDEELWFTDVRTAFIKFKGNTEEEADTWMRNYGVGQSYYNPELGQFHLTMCNLFMSSPDQVYGPGYEILQVGGQFKDYSFGLAYSKNNFEDTDGQLKASIEVIKGEDVAYYTLDCIEGALSESEISEAIYNLRINGGTHLTATAINVNAHYGNNTIVAVSYNTAGQVVETASIQFSIPNNKNWKLLGKCKYTDGIIYGLGLKFGNERIGGETWEADIQEDITCPGRYRLVNPYHTWPLNADNGHTWSLPGDYYIICNASDPTRVYIEKSELGIQLIDDWGPLHINSFALYSMEQGISIEQLAAKGHFGTNDNGLITFPGWTLLCGHLNNGTFGWVYADGDPDMDFPGAENIPAGTGKTTIDLRELGGIETTTADTDDTAPAEYFNLQGIRVANPSGGIFIERRGGKVTKRYIP